MKLRAHKRTAPSVAPIPDAPVKKPKKPGIFDAARAAVASAIMPTREAGTPVEVRPTRKPMMPSPETVAQFSEPLQIGERDNHQAMMGIEKRPLFPTPKCFDEPVSTCAPTIGRRLCDIFPQGRH